MTDSLKKIVGGIGLLFFVVIVAYSVTISATVQAAPDDKTDWSLAQQSTAAAQYFSHCLSPASKVDQEGADLDDVDQLPDVKTGTAGGMLGFLDVDITKDDQNFWAAPGSTKNQTEYPYQSLQTIDSDGDYYAYAAYGHALNYLGLDQTAAPNANTGIRWFVGLLMMILYVLSMGVNIIFTFALNALRVLNPFRLFMGKSGGEGSGNVILEGMDSFAAAYKDSDSDVTKAMASGVDNLSAKLRHLYSSSSNIGTMVVLPVLTACMLFSLTVLHGKPVGNKRTAYEKIKPWVLRLAFICFGVPLMFSCYDVVLSNLSDQVAVSNTMGTKMIASTFIDFDSWAMSYNLAFPNNIDVVDADGEGHSYTNKPDLSLDENGLPDARTVSQTRYITYQINRATGAFGTLDQFSDISSLHSGGTDDSMEGIWETTSSDQSSINSNFSNVMSVIGVLQKYMNGDIISSGAYEANVVKAKLELQSPKGTQQMFTDGCTWTNFQKAQNEDAQKRLFKAIAADYGPLSDWESVYNIWGSSWDGAVSSSTSLAVVYRGGLPVETLTKAHRFTNAEIVGEVLGRPNGLSAMSMYNYLNSSFTETAVVVYSPTASNSAVTRESHYAVNNVGNGLNSVLYILDAMAIMGCVAILGYAYALGLLFENFKAIFKIIPNVFLGLAGSLKGIATVVAYTIAMILEVIITIFLYCLACDLIVAAVDVIENPLAILFRKSASNALVKVLHPVLMIASIILIVILVKKALEWRKVVIQGVTEAATAVINKFMGTNATAPQLTANGGSKLGRVATIGAGAVMLGAATGSGSSGLATSSAGTTLGAVGDNLGVTKSAEDAKAAFGVTTNGSAVNSDSYATNNGVVTSGGMTSKDNYTTGDTMNGDSTTNVDGANTDNYSDANVDNSTGETMNAGGDEYADNYADDTSVDQRTLSETQQAEAYNEANSDTVERIDAENEQMMQEESTAVSNDNSQTSMSARDITSQEITDQQRNITDTTDDVVNLFNPDTEVRNQAWSNVQQGWQNAQNIHANANAQRAALTSDSAVTAVAATNITNNNAEQTGGQQHSSSSHSNGKNGNAPIKGNSNKSMAGKSDEFRTAGQNGLPTSQQGGQTRAWDASRGFNARPNANPQKGNAAPQRSTQSNRQQQNPLATSPQQTYKDNALYNTAYNATVLRNMDTMSRAQNQNNMNGANKTSNQNANRGQQTGYAQTNRSTQSGRNASRDVAARTRRSMTTPQDRQSQRRRSADNVAPTTNPTRTGGDTRPRK